MVFSLPPAVRIDELTVPSFPFTYELCQINRKNVGVDTADKLHSC